MKKIALFMTGLFAVATVANAQTMVMQTQKAKKTPSASYWSMGPTAGFGHSWLSNVENQNFKPAFSLGLGFVNSRNNHWAWGADIIASAEGYDMEYNLNGTMYDVEVTPIYLRLNPKVYYFFGDYGDAFRPKLYLGPSVAYKMDERQDSELNAIGLSDGVPALANPNNREIFNNFDAGLTMGVGANVRLTTNTWFNFDFGYTHGLLDVTNMDHMNRSLKGNVGVMFGL